MQIENYLFLNWFVRTKEFYQSITELLLTNVANDYLNKLYIQYGDSIKKERAKLKCDKIHVVTYLSQSYPTKFKKLDYPPLVLTYRGNLDLLNSKILAIVGSRRSDSEVEYWIYSEIKKIKNMVLLSGGAIGVDQSVHKAALMNGKETIIVSPVGIYENYPPSLKKLYSYFNEDNYLIISQFHPRQKILKSLFYPRNSTIAALCDALVIAQASEKSGTMVTAKYAIDFSKPVYAIPYKPWDNRFSGNTKLLLDGANYMIDLSLMYL